jgi:FtsZ-interacting cell division protein ZipA
MDEARRFERRYAGTLADRERRYLDAVIAFDARAARNKRRWVVAAFTFLLALVGAAAVALVVIRNAQSRTEQQRAVAEQETQRARAAEAEADRRLQKIQEQTGVIETRERERDAAKTQVETAQEKIATGAQELELTYDQLKRALAAANAAKLRAERATAKVEKMADVERAAKERVEGLLAKEKARVLKLEEEKRRLSTELK